MYGGNPPPFRHQAPPQQQPSQPPPQQQHVLQFNPNNYFPNPNLFMLPHINPFLQNPSTFSPPIQHQFNPNLQPQRFDVANGNNTNNNSSSVVNKFPQQQPKLHSEMVEKVDRAVTKARRDLLASNENVSSWKVSQAALLAVKADSWEGLGFHMQQVPSLKRLLVTEGKINAFMHCFVAARRITSLYDLEMAICESEGIERFEDLELGPLVQHPLAVHYFSVTSDVTEAHRIRTEEIVSYLCEFLDTKKRKEVHQVDKFLDFICKKQSVSGREKLCVRIQSFGTYINHIRKTMQSEDVLLEKCYEKIRKKPKQSKKRPLFSAQKKEMDDHFTAISQRMQSFSSENTQFCGKHIRFVSSSSEDDDSESNEYGDNQDQKNTGSNCSFSLSNVRSDRASSCPYPSATEEMTRLGLKSEVDSSPCTPGVSGRSNAATKLSKRKRGSDNIDSSTLLPRQPPKKFMLGANIRRKGSGTFDHSLSKESLMAFVATWKEACRVNNEDEVLERMLLYYKTRKRNKVKELFTLYPFVGLLNIAVTCIKLGMWDNIYDTLHTVSQENEDDKPFDCSADYISIDTQPAIKDVACSVQKIITHNHNVTAEDIVKKIIACFEDEMLSYKNPSRESKILLLTKICKCEYWLIEQYSVDKFESLGYGEYLMFLKKYMHLLPPELQKCIIGDTSENVSLEAHLLPIELDVLLSQASNSLWENKSINGENISELLVKQFPLVCFKLVNSDLIENSKTLREERCNRSSNCVLFSTPLLRPNCMGDLSAQNERNLGETNGFGYNIVTGEGFTAAVSTRDAIEVLLKAPMLTDLKLWMHWDLLFAPCLGSIVKWLLEEVNIEELLCLVTKDGKVIRLDHSATVDSFLKAFIGGSPFQTALEMLSLFALYGGERNVPLSLLKCHARQAFEVMINNYVEMELLNDKNLHMYQKLSTNQQIAGESISSNLLGKLANKVSMLNKAAPVVSKFVLDCLSHLPIEFCGVAADVLIAGLQPFVTDVPSAILAECKQTEQRLMLHEVGMSLGLMEWVNDYNSFRCSPTGLSHGSSCLDVVSFEFNTKSIIVQDLQDVQDKHPSSTEVLSSCEVGYNLKCKQASGGVDPDEVLVDSRAENSERLLILDDDPARVIESIRKEEFGLDQSLSVTENRMLEKQHARLGRALHCLSQELYSQDSHFLLELVQNADDNIYPENVEPTLTFIILEEGIVVLNNEQGFQANNIRALCDVGNSTKKGHNAGYIGKKGIGFKSVFRVTDAPEIHSNGFHIKFDITEGQIGFILPAVVPPRDIDCYTRLAFADADRMNLNSWNTCIVLPFRLNLSEGFAKNNILVMFADLHPSLLLFLHRLRCIMFRNTLDGTFTVMRKKVLGHGIIEVALGNEKMTWFVVSRELKADVIRSDVQTTEISVALTLQETDEGGYVPILQQQPVFAFLPLRTYGLKFILQGDFVLPSSREEVDGNSPWNQWLLSEFPDLFVSAERSFCDLPCYRGSPGKAITVFMSFVPLAGDVHGFFASLPRMVISKLRMSNCLILEGDENEWVPPCKVMRNWTDQAQSLLPDNLLHEHLGLGYLSKDVIISDSLARALGIEDYGPKVLLRVISSLCRSQNFLKSLGLSWLSSWLSTVYVMSSQWSVQSSLSFGTESDFIYDLQKIPFIPLSDGNYGSLNEGTIWLHSEAVGQGISDECLLEAFPKLYSKLRIVNPNLLAAAASIQSSSSDISTVENVTRMLYKVGVQRLFAHDIVKVQILPAVSDFKNVTEQDELMTEYLAFAMFHLQSSCTTCGAERGAIFAELREKALILTNYGYRRSIEVPIHFSLGYGSNIDVNKLISGLDMKWHEIETVYLKHPITISIPDGVLKWRNFFHEIGVTDFVQVVQTEKSVPNTSLSNFKDTGGIRDMISTDSVAKNWESEELFHLVSCISSGEDGEKSKYLLGILDKLWDDYFGDKVTGQFIDSTGECKPFNSSLISILQDSSWIVSSSDNKLHYPIDLFHDCVAVNLVLGVNAPYTIPKVRSENLAMQIGLKTQVTLDDALSVLRLWRASKSSFIASVSQMSQFYTFLWKGMALAKKKVLEELLSGPFIFVPNASSSSHDVVPGVLLSPEEVYWHDSIGLIDQTESVHPDCVTSSASSPHRKMLHNIYPNLHDFFVQECRVDESPPSRSYVQILLHLSTIALPHQVAKRVCEVLLMWGEALKSGSLSVEDVEYLKESLLKKECTVLPTRQDKWVSLHTSFGLICWCDDDNLGREFGHLGGVDFLYLGKSSIEENQMLQTKVSAIMQVLGIPALSKIVTREAIYYGPADSSFIYSLVNWVLPYAQRYIYSSHHDKYFQLKQTDFENLRLLKIVVVENLFYRNVIKKWEISSKKRHACNCLLKENILYCSQESDPHSIFLEFSCLLYGGTPELHFANFLHMITTMAESGATEEQTEFFILNSQKVPKLPADEPRWSLQSASLENSVENSLSLEKVEEEQNSLVLKRKAGNGINSKWPPADWKTAPGFSSVTAPAGNHQIVEGNKSEKNPEKRTDMSSPAENVINNIEMEVDDPTTFGLGEGGALLLDAELSESTHANLSDLVAPDRSMNILRDLHPLAQQQAMLTGKHGEQRAFEYFVGQVGEGRVKWVNEACETGLPYDIVFLGGGEGDDDGNNSIREYIEVKATKSATKNWFAISMREWQFAVEKGESFSIAHVVLADDNMTRITVYKNPARLCQLGNIKLALMVPKQQ